VETLGDLVPEKEMVIVKGKERKTRNPVSKPERYSSVALDMVPEHGLELDASLGAAMIPCRASRREALPRCDVIRSML
jgi:hypothetical protein